MSTIAPPRLSQLSMPAQPGRFCAALAFENGAFWKPPSWSRTTKVRMSS